MRRSKVIASLALATLAALTCTAAAPPGALEPYGVEAPVGVRIPVKFSEQITSLTANPGDAFEFETTADVKLGDVDVPAGTPGHGRINAVTRADQDHQGSLALQADSIDLPGGGIIWVNIDDKTPVRGHYADKHTHFELIVVSTTFSGNLVLEPGTPFAVITSARRAKPAPLVTPEPTPLPQATAPQPAATPKA